jgi:hypothetical protein
MTSKDYRKIINDKVGDVLRPRQFKKSGNTFKYSNGNLTYYIETQSSKSSTARVLQVTVNVGIGSELLYKLEEKFITSHLRGHFTRRIGQYLEATQDKWWTIDNVDAALSAAHEIASIINDKVLKEFDTIRTTDDLINLWMQGKYYGLTEYQRQQYLSILGNWEKSQVKSSGM